MNGPVDRLPCGVLAFDDDGHILRANSKLLETVGRARDEIVGQHLDVIFPRGGRIFYHTHFSPMIRMQGSVEEVYFELQPSTGSAIPVLINATRTEETTPPETLCIFVTVAQRGKYESAILEARRSAEQANQTKVKFMSMISHDLRSPLQAISGFSEALLRGYAGELNDQQREDVESIHSGALQVGRLIEDILGFATLESGRVEVRLRGVEVQSVFDRAVQLLRMRMDDKGVKLLQDPVERSATIVADPDRLQQILLNLMTNALKFTPSGGSVTLSYEKAERFGLIDVRDTGRGIEPDQLSGIFQPFYQVDAEKTDTSERGVGLGLAISRELARRMDGDLSVTSVPGEGSTFTVSLPLPKSR